jgi:AcrR family transcriptional regulator
MPSRLTASDRRQQILDVASGLFSLNGYQGTTTRQIAEEAGVNEALLFRHFPTKEKLYWTLIEELCSARGRQQRMNRIFQQGGSDFEVLRALALEFLNRSPRDRQLTRLLWFTALENHELSAEFFNTFVAEFYKQLASHIAERIRAGAFRKCDPLLAARGFVGMVVYHFLVQELFGGEQYTRFEPEDVATTLSHIWLAGMQNPNSSNGHQNGAGRNARKVRAGKLKQT